MNFHDVHNQALELMSSSTATNHPSTTTKIEVVDDEEEDTKASASTPTPPTTTSVVIEREHMFDKVVTPSDVGKLNRLVIPKQHAEKYFPLDSSNNEKGLLLNFEDRTGKPWRFRYSYWNSSQSYVMTKGWSRFVKEKKLDAGDIVSFQRGVGDKDKLFIDWRRRPDASTFHLPNHPFQHHHPHHSQLHYPHPHHNPLQHGSAAAASWTRGAPPAFVLRSHPYAQAQAQNHPYAPPPQAVWDPQAGSTSLVHRGMSMGMGMGTGHYGYGIGNVVNPAYPVTGSLVFVRSGGGGVGGGGGNSAAATTVLQNVTSTTREGGGGGGSMIRGESGEEGMVYESVPVVQGKAAAKRLRLFGVNMECPISHQTHDFDILSSSLASSSTSNDNNNHAHPRPHHHYHYNLLHQQQQQQQGQRQQQQQQHEQHHLQQHQQQIPIISMGPPSASSPNQQNSTIHDHHPNLQLRSFFNNGTTSLPPPKGKSSTSSSSMSLDLDI